jgi:hypothetical protein
MRLRRSAETCTMMDAIASLCAEARWGGGLKKRWLAVAAG